MSLRCCLLWLVAVGLCQARRLGDVGDDLTRYVSRPDIRAPIYNVTKLVPDQIAPGYWFVTPYTDLGAFPDRKEYTPNQVGPHIYDGDGNLVWSGAYVDGNRNTHDFRTYQVGNKSFISYISSEVSERHQELGNGSYVLMDDTYTKIRVLPPYNNDVTNIHEFQVFDEGRKALMFAYHRNATFNDTKGFHGTGYINDCLLEIDTATGNKDFEWCALDDGISPKEGVADHYRDVLHVNSIDKFANGDYLLSARHANTVYRISKTNRSVEWRLGGKMSDFAMNFNFTAQHHVKIISENASTTVISILDNASDGWHVPSANTSSALLVALHTSEEPKRAELLQQWFRPDGKLSDRRGSVLVQPNGNYLINWSWRGYLSEFTREGQLLMEAKFLSGRFNSYRVYKASFVGRPTEPPALKTICHETKEMSVTVAYVSWNGATEVASWQFEGSLQGSQAVSVMGSTPRTGFETVLTVSGVWTNVRAIALDAAGNKIGESAAVETVSSASNNNIATTALPSTNHAFLQPVTALMQNQSIVTMPRSSLWALLIAAVLVFVVIQGLFLAAFLLYRRVTRRSTSVSLEEKEIDLPLLERTDSKSDSVVEIEKGFKD